MKNCIVLIGVAVLLTAPTASGETIIDFPGLGKLIQKADAIVILRIEQNLKPDHAIVSSYSTYDCYVYQTLKGEIPANDRIRMGLMDTRSAFVSPLSDGSTHLMFLTKKRAPNEPTDYRTIEYQGANVLLSPFGHENMPAGKTTAERIRSLLKSSIEYNKTQHQQEEDFLKRAIGASVP